MSIQWSLVILFCHCFFTVRQYTFCFPTSSFYLSISFLSFSHFGSFCFFTNLPFRLFTFFLSFDHHPQRRGAKAVKSTARNWPLPHVLATRRTLVCSTMTSRNVKFAHGIRGVGVDAGGGGGVPCHRLHLLPPPGSPAGVTPTLVTSFCYSFGLIGIFFISGVNFETGRNKKRQILASIDGAVSVCVGQ